MENLDFNVWKKKSHKEINDLSIEVSQVLKEDPTRSPLYALFYAIDRGNNSLDKIHDYFKYFYVNEFSYINLKQKDLNNLLDKGINSGLIKKYQKNYYLTPKGKKIFKKARRVIMATNEATQFFFSEKVVLIFSFICLLFLSIMKITLGLFNGSDALLNDGIENLTDIIKIVIILISLKFKKDKIGAVIIILLMLFTGVNLVILSITSLLEANVITPTYFAFILMFISILINYTLMFLKHLVGKLKRNLSLLSDAKDNSNNIKISLGVLVGLIFALFGIYIVDAIMGILISCLIIYDGIDTLIILIKSGEELDLNSFKLKLDEAFEYKLTHWILVIIHEETPSESNINEKFNLAINKGRDVFGIWATFGLHDSKKMSIKPIIRLMIKKGLIIKKNEILSLTDKEGKNQYNKAILLEKRRVAKEIQKYKDWEPATKTVKIAWIIFGIFIFMGLLLIVIFIGPMIYNWILRLIHSMNIS